MTAKSFVFIVCAALCAWAGPAAARQGGVPAPSLFGSMETRFDALRLFPKWTGMLARYNAGAPACAGDAHVCPTAAWRRFIDQTAHMDRRAQIEAVNRFINRVRYIIDPRNYGVADYWAVPDQFFRRKGDCEDYAIAKFLTLRALGFGNGEMRILVLRDLNLRAAHAVLVVYHQGEALILDNQARRVLPAAAIHHYRAIYSINETNWWLHRNAAS